MFSLDFKVSLLPCGYSNIYSFGKQMKRKLNEERIYLRDSPFAHTYLLEKLSVIFLCHLELPQKGLGKLSKVLSKCLGIFSGGIRAGLL